MSSSWGNNLRVSIFGESHGNAIGVVLDSPPPGLALDMEQLAAFMARRAPGQGAHTTARKEPDLPQIQSGLVNGRTTGTPLCAIIPNTNTRSGDYGEMEALARPAHADYTGFVRYGGYNDIRGGGHFSGRLTAPLVFAGGMALQALAQKNIAIGAHIAHIHGVADAVLDPVGVTAEQLQSITQKPFAVIDDQQGALMLAEIETARTNLDSVGGVVECCGVGVPVGLGSPIFDGLENRIASLVFGVPGVKGIEFGAGFAAANLFGSQSNDPMQVESGIISHTANRHGGILGGISSGMPIVFRVAFKPTPSIAQQQSTVDYRKAENAVLQIRGRHDPCIVPRAVPCVEACLAIALMDAMMEGGNTPWI